MILNPGDLSESRIYTLMMGSIVPRPIAWVSTVDDRGRTNLAPFSYFTGVCCSPMTLLFCPVVSNRTGGKKDTLRNIEQVPEFVVNVVTESNVDAMNLTGIELPYGESEFDLARVTPLPSVTVRPPRVAETAIAFECSLQRVIEVNPGPGGGYVVLGTVQAIHIDDALYDPESSTVADGKLRTVARLGGTSFLKGGTRFSLPRYRSKEELLVEGAAS